MSVVAIKENAIAVRVAAIKEEVLSQEFAANGTFAPNNDLQVAAEMGGEVVKILVKEGDVVKVGQPLAHIKADRVNVSLSNARSVLENAQNEVKRFESAFATGGVTEQQLAQIRLQLKNAQANYDAMQITSTDAVVKSSIAGIVSSKKVEQGSFVGAGQVLFNVVNIDALKLQITVDETQVSHIKPAQAVKVTVGATGEVLHGKVSFVAPKASAALKFPVEVMVENKNHAIKAGMYATAAFQKQGTNAPQVVVPRSAFVGSVSQGKIFKVVDNVAQMVQVKTGTNFGQMVAIDKGLKAGDVVVVSGQINLTNGTPVKIVE